MGTITSKDAGIAVNGSYTASIGLVTELIKAEFLQVEDDVISSIAAFADELARLLVAQRLTLMAETVADYPDEQRRGGGGNYGSRNQSGGARPSTTSTDPATDKQKSYLADLLSSRVHTLDVDPATVNKAEAAQFIEQLKASPVAS